MSAQTKSNKRIISRLKFRFVAINMALLTLTVAAIFVGIYLMMYRSEVRISENMINYLGKKYNDLPRDMPADYTSAPDAGRDGKPRRSQGGDFSTGVQRNSVVIRFGEDGEITEIYYNMLNKDELFPDDSEIIAAAAKLTADGDKKGVCSVGEGDYRYSFEGAFLILLDRTQERLTMSRLLLAFLAIGTLGILALFGVSAILACWAIKPAATAWEQQRQFIADASHELKTPLTVIAASADIVLSNPADSVAHQAKWIQNIKDETESMSKLVQELLEIAKSDAGKSELMLTEFSVSDLADGVCLSFESVAFEAGKSFEYSIEPHIDYIGDRDRIKRLIAILIDNAISHSDSGGTVSLKLERDAKKIRLSVTNTGDPIPEHDCERIFERFYRVDNSRDRKTGGFGLGLPIAKTIVDAHGGSISVESRAVGNGGVTKFTVVL